MPGAPPSIGPSTGPSPSSAPPPAGERRRFVVAGAVIFGVLAVLLVIVLVTAPWTEGSNADRAQRRHDAISQPQSLSQPDYGRKPKHPGDPGGWEQLALLGLLVGALGGGGLWVVHTSRRAKRRRAAESSA